MRRRDTDRRCRKESKIVSVNKQICDTFTYNTILTMYMYLDKQDDSRFKGKHWINPCMKRNARIIIIALFILATFYT